MVGGMARDNGRVRERLGALEDGRWDLDEVGVEHERRAVERGEETPRSPQWLSEPVGSVSLWHERLVPERFRGTRWDPGRRGVIVLAAVGVAAVVVAAAAAQREHPVVQPVPPLPAARTSEAVETGIPIESVGRTRVDAPPPPPVPAELVISVVGLVEHPGLLHLPAGSRVADAIAVAVAKEGADLATLNLAQRLTDGDQVVVGVHGPNPGPAHQGSAVVPGGPRPSGTGHTSGASPSIKVNLNTATEDEFDALPGVGPATARAIITWRAEHGRFTSIDQLAEVTGVGPARLNRLRPLVTL